MKITIKLTKAQAKSLLESLPENHKIKIKVADLDKILGKVTNKLKQLNNLSI